MSDNQNLNKAKVVKNDEFYTRYEDIEKEVTNFYDCLSGKVVYCNCDDHTVSNFVRYFKENFTKIKLKGLISTSYKPNGCGLEYRYDGISEYTGKLKGDGDFRSVECRAILEEADVVITNPPFSLFRDMIGVLMEHNKKFLIIGSQMATTYKDTFKLLKDRKIDYGYNFVKSFTQPDGGEFTFGNICWYTNLKIQNREPLPLTKTYDASTYPKYDTTDAIEVSRVVNIPMDYYGVMGVPITYMFKHSEEQFKVIAFVTGLRINGKSKFGRLLIQRKV